MKALNLDNLNHIRVWKEQDRSSYPKFSSQNLDIMQIYATQVVGEDFTASADGAPDVFQLCRASNPHAIKERLLPSMQLDGLHACAPSHSG